jgi:hypothetical protein
LLSFQMQERTIDFGKGCGCRSNQRALYMPINQDGPVIRGTRQNLVRGLRAKPMTEPAVAAALQQAVEFTEQLVATYTTEIAAGEVGLQATARASEEPILGTRPPTVLLYGRVQSGKTAAMILTSALCLENGFRIIVVLTANNVALVEQTANRFKALDGPVVFSSAKDDAYEWEGQEDELRQDIADDGLVLVCAKDAFHLPRIIQFLQQIEAPSYPALVFDDEADAATPDTTLGARLHLARSRIEDIDALDLDLDHPAVELLELDVGLAEHDE